MPYIFKDQDGKFITEGTYKLGFDAKFVHYSAKEEP